MSAKLKPYVSKGHKLMIYHGWSDPSFSPLVSVNYIIVSNKSSARPRATAFGCSWCRACITAKASAPAPTRLMN